MNVGSVEVLLTLRDRLSAELAKPSSNLVKLSREVRQTELALAKLDDANTKAARSTRGFGDQVRTTLVHVAAAAAAYKALAAASQSVVNQVEFVRTFEKIENITGVTRAEVEKLRGSINALSTTTGKGPQELAEGFYSIASAGIKGAQATEILAESAKASAVGLGETSDIARSITAAINAYGAENLTAAQAANQLFVAVREGGAEASEVAGVFGRVVGVAAQMGVSFAEVGAFIATFTRLGVGADEAVTALRGSIMAMLTPTRAQEEALKALGTSMAELKAKVREQGLTVALTDLIKAAKGNEDAIGAIIPNVRSLAGVLGVAGNQADAYREIIQKVNGENDALANGFKNVSESASFKWDQLKAQFQQLSLVLGEALLPGVQAFSSALASIDPSELRDLGASAATTLSALGEVLKIVVAHFDAFKAIVAGLIILKFGAMLSAWTLELGATAVAAKTATGAYATLASTISAFTAPIAIAVGAALFLRNKIQQYVRESQQEIEAMVQATEAAGNRLQTLRQHGAVDIEATRAEYNEATKAVIAYKAQLDDLEARRAAASKYGPTDRRVTFLDEEIDKTKVLLSQEQLRLKQSDRLIQLGFMQKKVIDDMGVGIQESIVEPLKLSNSNAEAFVQRVGEVTTKLKDQLAAAKADLEVAKARQAQMTGALADARELSLQARTQLEIDKAIASLESNKHKLTAETRAEVVRLVTEWMRVKDETKLVNEEIVKGERLARMQEQGLRRMVEIAEQRRAHERAIRGEIQDEIDDMREALAVARLQLDTSEQVLAALAAGNPVAARSLQLQAEYLIQHGNANKDLADAMAEVEARQEQINYLIGKMAELAQPAWKIYLDAAFAALDAVGNALTDVIVQAGMTGKVEWENIWESLKQSLLQIFAEMLAEMLKRWIATQLAMKASSAAMGGGNAAAGGGGGLGSLAGLAGGGGSSTAGISGNTLGMWASAAFALYVVYRAFIEDHKTKFAEITISGGSANITAAHGRKYLQGVQDAAAALLKSIKDWMEQMDIMMTSFADISIRQDANGFGLRSGAQIIGHFKTAQEALDAAAAFMVRFGQFADSVPSLVQAAIRATSELSMEAITSNIEFARTLLTQNLDDLGQQMNAALELFASQMRRSMELFTGADLVQATDSAILHFSNSLHELYNTLTGHKDDPREAAERQRLAYNAQRAIIIAQIMLLMEEVRARIAAIQAHQMYLQRVFGNIGNPAGGSDGSQRPGGDATTWRGGRSKGGGALFEPTPDARNPSGDPQLAALLQVLDNLARALQGLPPEIAPGGVRPGRGSGGRGAGARDAARDFIANREFELSLRGMSEFQRELANIKKEYDDQLEQLGRNSAERARLLELQQQELALAVQKYQEDVRNRVDEATGVANAFTKIRKQFADLRAEVVAAGFAADVTADMLARLTQAELDAVQQLSDQMAMDLLGGLANYIDDAVVKQELLRAQSIIKFNMEMAQYRAQFELLKAQGLLTQEVINTVQNAFDWIAANANLMPGGHGAGGAPGFNPFVTGAGSPAFDPGRQLPSGQWSNVYIANGQRWAWFGNGPFGHWVNLGAVPTGGGGGGNDGGNSANDSWIAARKRALDLLEQYRNQGLNRWLQALKKLNDDFAEIRRVLGNTPQVAQAYADALARLREEFLSGIREFYDNMLTGPGSPLSVEQQFETARANYQRLLALVQAGDLSQADALRQAAQLFQQLAGQMFGTSTGGYASIFDQIRRDLAALLGIPAGSNVIGGPQWFTQGSQAQVAAIGEGSRMTVASISGLSNVVDMASYRQEVLLDAILTELRGQGTGGNGGGSSIAIGQLPGRPR